MLFSKILVYLTYLLSKIDEHCQTELNGNKEKTLNGTKTPNVIRYILLQTIGIN